MKTIQSIEKLIPIYNTFLIDLCGVIHDGINHYPQALEVILELKKCEKNILLISNSPRIKDDVRKKLNSMSKSFSDLNLITSGDFFSYLLNNKDEEFEFNLFKKKAFVIDEERKEEVAALFPSLKIAENIDSADYALLMAYTKNLEKVNQFNELMKKSINLGIPSICPNPDIVAISGENLVYTAGSYAKEYEKLGGKVYYLGKPHLSFYCFALSQYNLSLDKAIAIGDNLNTDIIGASNLKIDSILLKGGIYKHKPIDDIIINGKIFPTYLMNNLAI